MLVFRLFVLLTNFVAEGETISELSVPFIDRVVEDVFVIEGIVCLWLQARKGLGRGEPRRVVSVFISVFGWRDVSVLSEQNEGHIEVSGIDVRYDHY